MSSDTLGKSVQLYNNALSNNQLSEWKILNSDQFYWSYSKIISEEDLKDKTKYNHQFVHTVYKDYAPQSFFFSYCLPLLRILKVRSLYRIKLNLTLPTEKPEELGDYHNDLTWNNKIDKDCKVAIYYPFKTNGLLQIKEDDNIIEVENKHNQLVTFPNTLPHLGISNTDGVNRYALNIVYF